MPPSAVSTSSTATTTLRSVTSTVPHRQYRTRRRAPISLNSPPDARNRNEDARAVINSHRRRDNSVISPSGSATASAAYRPPSPIKRNGSTASEGLEDLPSCTAPPLSSTRVVETSAERAAVPREAFASATKRYPWP